MFRCTVCGRELEWDGEEISMEESITCFYCLEEGRSDEENSRPDDEVKVDIRPMKAWMVGVRGNEELGYILIHAETVGKAKSAALKYSFLGDDYYYDYPSLSARRCKGLDDKPLNIENAETVLIYPDAIDEDGQPYSGDYCTREKYTNCCPCEVCKGKR
jgi:hypothetical protein